MSYKVKKSTGILMNNQTFNLTAHIELLNLKNYPIRIMVEVLDWGNFLTQTKPVGTLLEFEEYIPAETKMALNATVLPNHHYEVRITIYSETDKFLINIFGAETEGTGWLEGYTVRNHELNFID